MSSSRPISRERRRVPPGRSKLSTPASTSASASRVHNPLAAYGVDFSAITKPHAAASAAYSTPAQDGIDRYTVQGQATHLLGSPGSRSLFRGTGHAREAPYKPDSAIPWAPTSAVNNAANTDARMYAETPSGASPTTSFIVSDRSREMRSPMADKKPNVVMSFQLPYEGHHTQQMQSPHVPEPEVQPETGAEAETDMDMAPPKSGMSFSSLRRGSSLAAGVVETESLGPSADTPALENSRLFDRRHSPHKPPAPRMPSLPLDDATLLSDGEDEGHDEASGMAAILDDSSDGLRWRGQPDLRELLPPSL